MSDSKDEFVDRDIRGQDPERRGGEPARRILVLCSDFVENLEVFTPVHALLGLGCRVDTVCPDKEAGDVCKTAVHDFEGDQTYSEKVGNEVRMNKSMKDVDVGDYDALIIPGGRAPEALAINKAAINLVKQFNDARKIIAAICHGPVVLAAAGILEGKRSTAYPGCRPMLTAVGAKWMEKSEDVKVVSDGNLITAPSWEELSEFLAELYKALNLRVDAQKKRLLMLCADFVDTLDSLSLYFGLRSYGFCIDTASPGKKKGTMLKTVLRSWDGEQTNSERLAHHIEMLIDWNSISPRDYAGMIIPSGRSCEVLSISKEVHGLIRKFSENGAFMGCIGQGSTVLASAGVMKNIRCTGSRSSGPFMMAVGADWIEPQSLTQAIQGKQTVSAAAWPAQPAWMREAMASLGVKASFSAEPTFRGMPSTSRAK